MRWMGLSMFSQLVALLSSLTSARSRGHGRVIVTH